MLGGRVCHQGTFSRAVVWCAGAGAVPFPDACSCTEGAVISEYARILCSSSAINLPTLSLPCVLFFWLSADILAGTSFLSLFCACFLGILYYYYIISISNYNTYNIYMDKNPSIIDHTFAGFLKSSVICKKCKYASGKFKSFYNYIKKFYIKKF